MDLIYEARKYLLELVIEPAIASSISQEYKNKAKSTKVWINNFEYIGDLIDYLKRFRLEVNSDLYTMFKSHNLLTFEDVFQDFIDRFESPSNLRSNLENLHIGEEYTSHQILILAKKYDTRVGGILIIGDNQAVVIKATLDGGDYPNEWLKENESLKYYLKSINGKHSVDYKENAVILNTEYIPIYTFIRKTSEEPFVYQGVFKYHSIGKDKDGALWFELNKWPNESEEVQSVINSIEEKSLLDKLKPQVRTNVIDVLKSLEIDVSSWGYRKNGSPIENPSLNSSKSSDWTYGGVGSETTVLFLWHSSLKIDTDGKTIFIKDSFKSYKEHYSSILGNTKEGSKHSASPRYEKAQQFERVVAKLFESGGPCRVALLTAQDKNNQDDAGDERSVKFRELDSENWYVHGFSWISGEFKLVRGITQPIEAKMDSQFDLNEPPDKYPTTGSAYWRSLDIKEKVLSRSNGICEFCSTPAFQTYKNTLFLEVHHAVPLGKNGVDALWNVVAICPNHHREAHFGLRREEMLSKFVDYLGELYPESKSELVTLARNVTW
jgi:hypothetical protein